MKYQFTADLEVAQLNPRYIADACAVMIVEYNTSTSKKGVAFTCIVCSDLSAVKLEVNTEST